MKKISFVVFFISVSSMLFLFGCKKNDAVDQVTPHDTIPASTEQLFSFQLQTTVGNIPADFVSVFTDATGRKFSLSDFRFYLSKIVLIKDDNNELPITDTVILGSITQQTFPLAVIPVGSYKGFKFLFGLDSATNHSDPTIYPSSSPLSLQNNPLHWSWNSGYIFMKLEGLADTTLNNTGTPNENIVYHLGTDKIKRDIDFSNESFTVVSGTNYVMKLNIDLRKLLQDVDLRTDLITMSPGNLPLSSKIADNWQSTFTIQ